MGSRKKSKGSRQVVQAATEDPELADLLDSLAHTIDRAVVSVALDRPSEPRAVGMGEPCGPVFTRPGTWVALSDPLLLDRYQGLLVRSAVVGGSVHTMPSRTRERTEDALRELIVGVARGRSATGARVDHLVGELVELIGERIVCSVETWNEPSD